MGTLGRVFREVESGEVRWGSSGEVRSGSSGEVRLGSSGEVRSGSSGEVRAGTRGVGLRTWEHAIGFPSSL